MVRAEFLLEIIVVSESAVSVALKRNAQCKPKFVRTGGQQLGGIIGHAG